ncbi:hypothetical protein EF847_03950 [Actinobacteria bacterium YIM 96077]|uniref:PH domain-containing protein n=1 Tax=Phytoactinopolyspora halophila TaxID=1981511 RepID=A0A329R2H6_9ACTN|nr:hypothetical protein [Phytoactinopolyspora halophila]AYY11985.1 hypothetical protein EF847_03950 [Actinobacteria bacterium YIM 96077]RAW18780.1 hypothetical protein DPM12_01560 [Phytoactinopolyspora halophila]
MAARAIAPSERVLVPSGPMYRRLVGSTPVLLGALAALLVARSGLVGLMAASIVALTLAGVAQFLRRERIVVTPTHIRSVRPIGWPRKRARDDIAIAVSVRVAPASGRRAHRNLFLLDGRDRLIARLKGPRWTPEDMRQLLGWLGVQPHELEHAVTARKLGRRFPRAVPISERYPFAYGVTVGAVLAGAIVAASLLVD